jgi:hypothetical protein
MRFQINTRTLQIEAAAHLIRTKSELEEVGKASDCLVRIAMRSPHFAANLERRAAEVTTAQDSTERWDMAEQIASEFSRMEETFVNDAENS